MAYSELIKNFNRIREYMREFYVYGFKSRDEYSHKSARSYDYERRRLESWLGDYMGFRQSSDGKNLFLSIDSRVTHHNPLYKAFKAKSFTAGDITLHFILFDILSAPDISKSLNEIVDEIDDYLFLFNEPKTFDSSTVRKKLNEYVKEGIIVVEKQGKTMYYSRATSYVLYDTDVLDFFSEVVPCGVIGSYLLDKENIHDECFAFKHHYITGAMDSEVVCDLLTAISQKRYTVIETVNNKEYKTPVVPLRLMLSAQSGRHYVMVYHPRFKRITPFRTDHIISVTLGDKCENFAELRETLDTMQHHMWGVSTQSTSGARIEHVEFTVKYGDNEEHIHRRLLREKRCGTVEKLDEHTSRFSVDVFDTNELVPWIRTFICRITDIKFSNKPLEEQFKADIKAMYKMYDIDGGGAE